VSGLATGSISNLVNISQNDILKPQQRGKFQGIQGMSVALGSLLGQLLAASLVTHGETLWVWLHHIVAVLSAGVAFMIWNAVPTNVPMPKWKAIRAEFADFDWLGMLFGAGFIASVIIALCEGPIWGWGSAESIALFIFAGVCLLIFCVLGSETLYGMTRLPERQVRPVLPFRFFKDPVLCIIFVQNNLFGAVYWSFITFMPFYWQVVQSKTIMLSAVLFIPYIGSHGIVSSAAGFATSMLMKRNLPSWSLCLWIGFGSWTLAKSLLAAEGGKWPAYGICILEVLVALGSGSVFQTSVNAIRTRVDSKDNARAVGTRNISRYLGGAWGTALMTALVKTFLESKLPPSLQSLANEALSKANLSHFNQVDQAIIGSAYSYALCMGFALCAGLMGVCFLLCPGLNERTDRKATGDEERIVATPASTLYDKSTSLSLDLSGYSTPARPGTAEPLQAPYSLA
jgi:hypothetical protein